jgi:alginate O-acetyltransferase complex protein AlgI
VVFSSHIFLFYFLPVFLASYYLLYHVLNGRGNKISVLNGLITIASYFFYGWFEPWFVSLMWVSTIVDYYAGKAISSPGASSRKRNTALTISMVVNLGLLFFFKYYMFFMGGLNHLIDLAGGGESFFYIYAVTLPIGISFYTFQTMSYTIDVWRGDAPPVKNFSSFACFVALFPQLIAGPIIRYNTVARQLVARKHSIHRFANGALLFSVGLAKKIIIANSVGEIADAVFGADSPGALVAWWGALAYAMQIYFDFSAYSDMAVGLGRMLGFEFMRNFNAPYQAHSISNFWRRWHISLTRWFTDYVYIPLGGNRVASRERLYANLVIVMLLSGLWHGAQWTFIAWGAWHAAFLLWERTMGKKTFYSRLPWGVQILLTQVIVLFGWVLFRAPDISQAWLYWQSMLGLREASLSAVLLPAQVLQPRHIVLMLLAVYFTQQRVRAYAWVRVNNKRKWIYGGLFLWLSIALLFTQSFNPFLYFQF